MAKAQSPLLGYNTNVRHKGRVFHIQTEDSGIARPHVITHLFADGGRVLKTAKTSYAELVSADDVQVQVKKLMQDQHRAMFVALRDGHFDAQFDVPTAAPPPTFDLELRDETPTLEAPPPQAAIEPVVPEPFDLESLSAYDDAIEIDESAFIEPTEAFAIPVEIPLVEPIPTELTPPPVVAQPPAPARSAKASGPWLTAPRAPTPAPSVSSPAPSFASSKPPPLGTTATRSATPAIRVPAVAPPPPTRAPLIAALQPAPAAPAARSATGFGERLVTERSLDEVILAYLAEELDEPRSR